MTQGTASLPARDNESLDRHGAHARVEEPPDRHVADIRETLDRYAAAGGMAPDHIRRILADLTAPLATLHRAGRTHGDISPPTIGLDAEGRAHLLTPPLAPTANAEDAPRRDGYAAFEQYTDDPDTPCGPWSDVYALSATACALLTGLTPPPALARCVRDDYVPLTQRRGQEEYAFCAVLDTGLAVDAYERPQTIDEFSRALHLDMTSSPRHADVDAASRERRSTLEDSDGLEATSAWVSTQAANIAANASFDASTGVSPEASIHGARGEPEDAETDTPIARARDTGRASGTATGAMPPAGRTAARQRPPLLTILVVMVMVAAALYIWLRPQAPRRADVVASASAPSTDSASSSSTSGARQPQSDAASAGGASVNPAPPAEPAGTSNPSTATSAAPGSATQSTTAPWFTIAGETQSEASDATTAGAAAITSPPSTSVAPPNPNAAAKARTAASNKTPVAVSITIRPWGEVLVNGRSRGVSPPLNSLNLAPGKYEITIRNNANPDYHQVLNVTADKNAAIVHTFQ